MKCTLKYLATLFFFTSSTFSFAQETKWFGESPEMMQALEGRGWDDIGFNRLPDSAVNSVRTPVWNLSRQTAGLMLRFTSDSEEISVSYLPTGNIQMPHMPATGVSGVDLYTKDETGNWLWIRGSYQFGEKVSYKFHLDNDQAKLKEFYLFLPLYNGLTDLEIGVPDDKNFAFTPKRVEKPILIYGTSIAQGASASRAGMAWTNILAREMNMPMINLGFSGNGRMEPEVIDLLTQIDPAIFVLDCLPNLGSFSAEEVKEKLIFAVNTIRTKYPDTPILLTEHAGYSDGMVYESRAEIYTNLNIWLQESFDQLLTSGVSKIYTLTKDEIGMGIDDFVDGTHPSDLGMVKYSSAYSKKFKEILGETR
ncbi:SGNH-like hydrolase/esterase family protein [Algoriphagus ratkowskyi]|uniref:Hydrolase n=1 Tax=Algoriphagus ratkowskyi TaxID=57028 RepID=A0A2W7RNP1_9BACT|nr:SGNH/GDSL hydrolase family protein [Algoriphagus ratkowskyi]PZX56079.1 SGNH-like hydrolase/esterase family protein [Algoriphagus ratkowskyi]TXD77118.1 hydrolase [Algoriphagus ratkowskyi]